MDKEEILRKREEYFRREETLEIEKRAKALAPLQDSLKGVSGPLGGSIEEIDPLFRELVKGRRTVPRGHRFEGLLGFLEEERGEGCEKISR